MIVGPGPREARHERGSLGRAEGQRVGRRQGLDAARSRAQPLDDQQSDILAACRNNGIAFLQGCTPDNITARIDEGVRVIAGHSEASALKGRAHQKRTLPV